MMKLSSINDVAKKVTDRQTLIRTRERLTGKNFHLFISDGASYESIEVPDSVTTVEAVLKMMMDDVNSKIKTLNVELRELGVSVDTEEPVLNRLCY